MTVPIRSPYRCCHSVGLHGTRKRCRESRCPNPQHERLACPAHLLQVRSKSAAASSWCCCTVVLCDPSCTQAAAHPSSLCLEVVQVSLGARRRRGGLHKEDKVHWHTGMTVTMVYLNSYHLPSGWGLSTLFFPAFGAYTPQYAWKTCTRKGRVGTGTYYLIGKKPHFFAVCCLLHNRRDSGSSTRPNGTNKTLEVLQKGKTQGSLSDPPSF